MVLLMIVVCWCDLGWILCSASGSHSNDDTSGNHEKIFFLCSRTRLAEKTMSLPSDAPSFSYNGKNGCSFTYDAQLLRIVLEETILDVIDTNDMIGARLEMELKTSKPIAPDRASNEPPSDILVDRKGSMTLVLYVYPRRNTGWFGAKRHTGPRVAHHRRLVLAPSEDLGAAQTLVKQLNRMARGNDTATTKRYWIIVNPLSGPKQNAAILATSIVVPMLEEANIDCTVTTTTHARHAQSLVSNEANILEYDALILMGGDGLIHEVVNGIRERTDDLFHNMERLPLGIIGCGTSNGLATSLTYAAREDSGIMQDTFLIAKGKTIPADISSYQIGKRDATIVNYASFLTFSWSMIADIDIDSECLRFLGESRYDVWYVVLVHDAAAYLILAAIRQGSLSNGISSHSQGKTVVHHGPRSKFKSH